MADKLLKPRKPPFRSTAFTHWANLGFLAVGGIAGALYDPSIWWAVTTIEGAILWILPDLPPYRKSVERAHDLRELLREREYYLGQLWDVEPQPEPEGWQKVMSWLVEQPPARPLDDRIIRRSNSECQRYFEMRTIVKRLEDLVHLRGSRIRETDIRHFEQLINGYLRLLIASAPLAQALGKMDERAVRRELSNVEEKARGADQAVRAVLGERQRLLEAQLERIPRLQATLELIKTRADTIVYQLQNIHSQVLADPGTDIHQLLDEMAARQDSMDDPLRQLESDQMVRDFLDRVDAREGERAPEDGYVSSAPPGHQAAGKTRAG